MRLWGVSKLILNYFNVTLCMIRVSFSSPILWLGTTRRKNIVSLWN